MRINILVVNQPSRNWRRLIPGLLVSLAALIVILYYVDLDRFFSALLLADYRLICLLFVLTFSWVVFRALVWRALLREQASFSQVFLTLNEGYLINNVLPFRLGEVGRAFLISKKVGLEFLQAFSTILIERSLDVIMAVGLLLITFPFIMQTEFAPRAAMAAGGVVLAGLIFLHLLARNQSWGLEQFHRLASRFGIIRRFMTEQRLKAAFAGLETLINGRRFLKVVLLMIGNWGWALIQFHVLLRAYFPGSPLLWAAFTLSVMSLGIAAPSSPGAIGVLEVSVIGALSAFHLDPSTALAAALTAHFSNYLVTGLIGGFALAHDGLSLFGLFRDVSGLSKPNQNELE